MATTKHSIVHTIPSYPYSYPTGISCKWLISAVDGDYTNFQFMLLFIETNRDFLGIGVGHNVTRDTMVMDLTGVAPPSTLSVKSREAWMSFYYPRGNWWGFVVIITTSNMQGL